MEAFVSQNLIQGRSPTPPLGWEECHDRFRTEKQLPHKVDINMIFLNPWHKSMFTSTCYTYHSFLTSAGHHIVQTVGNWHIYASLFNKVDAPWYLVTNGRYPQTFIFLQSSYPIHCSSYSRLTAMLPFNFTRHILCNVHLTLMITCQ